MKPEESIPFPFVGEREAGGEDKDNADARKRIVACVYHKSNKIGRLQFSAFLARRRRG